MPWSSADFDHTDEALLDEWRENNMQVLELPDDYEHWALSHFLRFTVYKHAQGRPTAAKILQVCALLNRCEPG